MRTISSSFKHLHFKYQGHKVNQNMLQKWLCIFALFSQMPPQHSSLVDYLAQVICAKNCPATFYCIFQLVWSPITTTQNSRVCFLSSQKTHITVHRIATYLRLVKCPFFIFQIYMQHTYVLVAVSRNPLIDHTKNPRPGICVLGFRGNLNHTFRFLKYDVRHMSCDTTCSWQYPLSSF